MADEPSSGNPAETNPPAEQNPGGGQKPGGEPDYKALYEGEKAAHEKAKAESRKWENFAKSNKEKAEKWDAASGGSDSIEQRIAALEDRNKALEDEKERAGIVAKVSKDTGVPAEIVATLNGEGEEELAAQAKAISSAYKTPGGAPKVPEAGKFPKEKGKSQDDDKRQFVRDLLGNVKQQ